MFKRMMFAVVLSMIFISGCSQIMNPDSNLNKATTVVEDVGPTVAAGAAATGTPVGASAAIAIAVATALAGAYNNYRKKLVIAGIGSRLANTTITTKAIVNAIENVGGVKTNNGTLGMVIKDRVKTELQDKEAYRIGKAIIDGLK